MADAAARSQTEMAEHRNDDEGEAFREAMRDVKPLAQQAKPAGSSKAPLRRVRRRRAVPLSVGVPEVEPGIAAERVLFQRAGLRKDVVRRLRRGLIPIGSEIDLHGLTEMQARAYLEAFIAESRDAGLRCVRIIHGKGHRSGARGPILKIAVDAWLRRDFDVLAFAQARPIDGGSGALYVLLRA